MSSILYYVDLTEKPPVPDEFSPSERDVLDRINQKVAAADSLQSIVGFLLEAIHPISPCDRVGLAFVEEAGWRAVLYCTAARYDCILLKQGYAEDLAGSSLEALLERRQIRVIHDLEAYLQHKPRSTSTKVLVREGVRSSMTCPLVVEGRTVGLLFRSSRRPRDYDAHQVRMHQAVAERISQAVEKAYRIEQLAAANYAYTEMLSFVTHEIKSPVASIVTHAELFTKGYLGELEPRQKETLQRMVRTGRYLLDLIREYLNLARVEAGQLELSARTDVDFTAEAVEPAIDMLAAAIDEKNMRLTRRFPAEPVLVEVDPALMRIVVVNLIGNAIKYGREGGEIRVHVDAPGAGGEGASGLTVSVWNEGPGFPESERPRLFRRFSRLKTPELLKEKGTGVGLYTCWRIVRLHGGRISARSEPGEWAEFTLTIPQPPVAPAVE